MQRLLIAAAWIGTAIVAYSIGSLRSPSPALPAVAESVRIGNGAALGADGNGLGADIGERPLDGGHGATNRSLSDITGSQPLGDYLKRVMALDDDIKRTSAFLEVLGTLETPEQIREALEVVAKSGRGWGRGASSREFAMLLQKWTALDPKSAADYAVNAKSRDERYMAMGNVLRNWTRTDAHAALAWAQANGMTQPGDSDRPSNPEDGNYAVAMVVSNLARTDLDLALSAASAEGNSRSTTRLADDLADELNKQRGEEAAREAILALPESKLRDSMIAEHADRLAKTDGAAASKWAASLPTGPARSRALAEAIAGWAEKDPASAGTFLNAIPPSTDSDAARERFARNVVGKDPVGAISWAGTITDPEKRQGTTESIVRSWVRRDTAAATPWVMQSAAFTPETKQRLLAPSQDTRGRN